MKTMKELLYSAYLSLCHENDVVPGSKEAAYLWKEYASDLETLAIIHNIEESGTFIDERS